MDTENYYGNPKKDFWYYVKRFFFYILKSMAKLVINLFIGFIFIIFIAALFSGGLKDEEGISSDSFLKLSFSQDLKEEARKGFMFDLGVSKPNLFAVLEAIEEASTDERIKGIIIDLDNFNLSSAHLEEIKEKLESFKKMGKKIYAYGTSISNQAYKIALVADSVVMPPTVSAEISLKGYFYSSFYYKKLEEKLGIKFTVINTGNYKTYGENYTRENISSELRSELTRIYDERYKFFINEVSKIRKIENKELEKKIFNGELVMLTPKEAKENKLIDKLMYEKEFERNEVKTTTNGKKIVTVSKYIANIRSLKETNITPKDKIAIIYAEGEILNVKSDGSGFDDENIVTPEKIREKLRIALDDSAIKGIVIRVNSPGGSALASDLIMNEISEAMKRKTVYISMGNVAASGGYYISCVADKIFANPGTITGSIGVVSMIPSFGELTNKIGITNDTIKKGKYTDIYNMTREPTSEEIEFLHKKMVLTYNEFKENVSKGRKIKFDAVENIAQGKIWTGIEAKDIKLVDEKGGLLATIYDLAKNVGINDYEIVELIDEENIFNKIALLTSGMDSKTNSFMSLLKTSGVYDTISEYEKALRYDRKPALILPLIIQNN